MKEISNYSIRLSIALLGILLVMAPFAAAQTVIDTSWVLPNTDTLRFWAQIPANYSREHPPAILIYWHQLGGIQYEMRDASTFDTEALDRGWIAACHRGNQERHWNTARAQMHCRLMLDCIAERFPFCRDSIYMFGGSMGGAGGMIWHNNNCGPDDYLIAATAGGSPILDAQYRAEQYLALGDTNRSMRAAFGGLPSERDSVRFEYNRASAVHFADTTRSMHFNGLYLPIYATHGTEQGEIDAYGIPLGWLDSLREFDNADTTWFYSAGHAGHGINLLDADSVCNWLSAFTANRYPDAVSINADENDSYYWTDVELMQNDTVFGRYVVIKDSALRRIEATYIRNVAAITVNIIFPWPEFQETDSLRCVMNVGNSPLETSTLVLAGIPEPDTIMRVSGVNVMSTYEDSALTIRAGADAEFILYYYEDSVSAVAPPAVIPQVLRIVSAYPNPFNSEIALDVESPLAGSREILLHNITGQLVRTLTVNLKPGMQRVLLSGNGLASGTYFLTMPAASQAPIRIVLLK
ncbi:T9SS C-terminal target domain-containing protein [candidate division KSB1 bacterium]|nr:MAG: T9SS C-terminal target domain-containing protein [candidate division KSB1 bacterium]